MAYEFIKDLSKAILPSLLGLGTGLIANNQVKQQAKGQAKEANDLAEKQYQIALANQRTAELQSKGGGTAEKPKSNTALYIGLGVGGVVLIGVVIFAVTRK
jgi:hypothetical protein